MAVPELDPPDDSVLAHAYAYTALQWRVIPIPQGSKHPALNDWVQVASLDPATIDQWWTRWPGNGLGIVTGQIRPGVWLVVIDVDDRPAAGIFGSDTLADLEHEHGRLPDTVEAHTGSGGRHIYLEFPCEIRNDQAGLLGPGLDLRGEGGQVLAPPTIHPNGNPYLWEADHAPWEIPVADAPAWLVEVLTSRTADQPREDRPKYEGPPRPGDRFAASVSWPELLRRDGATFMGARKDRKTGHGYELWCRPGKDPKDGASASLYYGGSDVLKVFTPNWDHLAEGHTYTRFGYWTAVTYGEGQYSKAAGALAAAQHEDDIRALVGPSRPLDAPTAPADGQEDEPAPQRDGHGWETVDLGPYLDGTYQPPVPDILRLEDGRCLLYRRRINGLFGVSGGGKTWVAVLACAQLVADGEHVLILDHEDHPETWIDRLRALGLSDGVIRAHLHYVNPQISMNPDATVYLVGLVRDLDVALVVIDSKGESMGLEGLDDNSSGDVVAWANRIARPLADAGAGVLDVDHVVKDPEANQFWPAGSQRKRALVDGHLIRVNVVEPFSKDKPGKLALLTAKDRGGNWTPFGRCAELTVTPGETLGMRLASPPVNDSGEQLPIKVMEAVSEYLELAGASSVRAIKTGVGYGDKLRNAALEALERDGWVRVEDGARGARLHAPVARFRQSEWEMCRLGGVPYLPPSNADQDPTVLTVPDRTPPCSGAQSDGDRATVRTVQPPPPKGGVAGAHGQHPSDRTVGTVQPTSVPQSTVTPDDL